MADAYITAEWVENGGLDEQLTALYGAGALARERGRYAAAVGAFAGRYGSGRPVSLYSVPGRTEVCGNHQDHQNGRVVAAAVGLDIIAVVGLRGDHTARVQSAGFEEDVVDLSLLQPQPGEEGRSAALIRGVAAGFSGRGGAIGGFDAYTTSDVLKGSGLSSSAAFEVCMATILNHSYNAGRFTATELALISRHAENHFFAKPSGLMDQLACAAGGMRMIDFEAPDEPHMEELGFDPAAFGLQLVVTDTKGDHADLTDDYSAIRSEVEAVARHFGRRVLREVAEEEFYAGIAALRADVGDRAVLRATHYFGEFHRVGSLAAAMRAGDADAFCRIIVESGASSYMYNQNAYSLRHPARQEMPLALALSQRLLAGRGAWRLQGGGFAGTIQAFVPQVLVSEYSAALQAVFGADACLTPAVRRQGAVRLVLPE